MKREQIYKCTDCGNTRTVEVYANEIQFPETAGFCVCSETARYLPLPQMGQSFIPLPKPLK